MRLFARAMFGLTRLLAARGGLGPRPARTDAEEGREHLRVGARAELLAYWYLRREGYTVIRRNFRSPRGRGEIDLIGWDGGVLAFVEVKARTTPRSDAPEVAVNPGKQQKLLATARDFLARQRLGEISYRFDVLALDARDGSAPTVRLHKGAFGSG